MREDKLVGCGVALWFMSWVLGIVFWVAVGFIVWHFLHKYW